MRSRFILATLAPSLAVLAPAVAQAPANAPVVIRPGEIVWQPAPPALEPGAKGAVLAGNPVEPGPLTLRVRLPDRYRIAPHRHSAFDLTYTNPADDPRQRRQQ